MGIYKTFCSFYMAKGYEMRVAARKKRGLGDYYPPSRDIDTWFFQSFLIYT
jgi:hypothetical protein